MSSLGLQGAPLVTHPSVSGSKFIRAMTDLVNGRAPDSAMLARMWSAKVIDHHDVGVSRSSVVDQPFLVRRYANPAISKDFERTFLHESNSPDSLSCEVEEFNAWTRLSVIFAKVYTPFGHGPGCPSGDSFQ